MTDELGYCERKHLEGYGKKCLWGENDDRGDRNDI